MGVLPQPLVLSWMGPSVDELVKSVVTARELNAQAGNTDAVACSPCRSAHRPSWTTLWPQLLFQVDGITRNSTLPT